MAKRIGFPAFARRNLFIRTKAGEIAPFRLNAVQRTVHARIEAHRARTGRVRVLVLKARQPGISTYVEGRFYWLVTRTSGVRAFILTHLRDATEAIFEMVERFHERNPDEARPHVGAANAKELWFDELDSGYRVGTAGSRAIGRGHTIQRIHGVTLVLLDSMGGEIGPGPAHMKAMPFRTSGDAMDVAVPLFTGEKYIEFEGDFGTDTRVRIQGRDPVPFTLLAVAPEIKTNTR